MLLSWLDGSLCRSLEVVQFGLLMKRISNSAMNTTGQSLLLLSTSSQQTKLMFKAASTGVGS